MESVTKECADGLSHLDMLEVGAVASFVEQTSAILCRSCDTEAKVVIDSLSPSTGDAPARVLYSAMCSVLIEGAKSDCTAENMGTVLEEAGVGKEIASGVARAFEGEKSQLRWMLRCTGLGSQRSVVDLAWRLDYLVRSSTTGIEHVPVFFVSLKTKGADGSLGSEEFTCSQEQMHDLLATVKDASKQVERLLASD
mmetsp:Transcript_4196/g.8098  ORF Transcript_4196/g.8098 Transcript_4196/m.8098 type:complete len:196 (-) Transcript_4196:91-678(-)